MYSSPRAEPGRSRRHPPRDWSLRARLLAGQLVLLALVCVVIGSVTELALHQFLVGKLDTQLVRADHRSEAAVTGGHPGPPGWHPPATGPGPEFLYAPGQAPFTLGVRVSDGTIVRAGVITVSGAHERVPADALGMLTELPADGVPATRDLGKLGDYRLITTHTPDGKIITGLPLSDVTATLWQLALVLVCVAAIGLLIAAITGALIVRRTLRPLRRVADTAQQVSHLPLDRGEVALPIRVPEVDTNQHTEVGQVGGALNRLLEHVHGALSARQASEMRVRQFVADASHELRTPLTAIRGYAELTRHWHDHVPDDVARALARVESEAGRMTTLVEDLLLLARLDAGRPLEQETVDLSRLLADAVSDAQVAGPDHRWRLDLPPDPVLVTGDTARLHQVAANLLANARAHTPTGTTVTTGLSAGSDGSASMTVTDDGPGIPAELLPEVFTRFTRGETSRARTTGSTGLGLAIVAAVTAAHHGRVAVDSASRGTTFTVTLPADS